MVAKIFKLPYCALYSSELLVHTEEIRCDLKLWPKWPKCKGVSQGFFLGCSGNNNLSIKNQDWKFQQKWPQMQRGQSRCFLGCSGDILEFEECDQVFPSLGISDIPVCEDMNCCQFYGLGKLSDFGEKHLEMAAEFLI